VTAFELHAGQRWRLLVRLRRPHGNYNAHGFDLERWLLDQNIRAGGYVRTASAPRLLSEGSFAPRYSVERLREKVRQSLLAALADAPLRGVLVALAVGDQLSSGRSSLAPA
jgi:competence protein ComEC